MPEELQIPGAIRCFVHGQSGPAVFVLHGGPGAMGDAAPLARGISGGFRVLEPWQRGSGDGPLTVARHVEDLHSLIRSACGSEKPALVGESWGAMLALAYAAEHPDGTGPIALVGCGTFNRASRDRMLWNLIERTDAALKNKLKVLDDESMPPEEWVKKRFELMAPLYIYEPNEEASRQSMGNLDVKGHGEAWEEMVRLQEAGVYPASFSAIKSPVLMIHGDHDPHPGRMIRDSLMPYLPQLEYVELERCGHQPWLEKRAAEGFFKILNEWLERHLKSESYGT